MKHLIFILDGVADERDERSGLTPLQEAKTPTFDLISSHGIMGRVQTIPDGFPAGTDVAMSTLLGATEQSLHTMGRASIEGTDIPIKKDQCIARINFLSMDMKQCICHYFTSDSDREEQQKLFIDLGNDAEFNKICAMHHIRFVKKNNGEQMFVLYPKSDCSCVSPLELLGKPYASFENKLFQPIQCYTRYFLQNHPINEKRKKNQEYTFDLIWPWGDGERPTLWNFPKRYNKTMGIISTVPIIRGLATLANIDNIPDDNLKWTKYDVLFFHFEDTDTFSHEGNRFKKIRAIEQADEILENLLRQIEKTLSITIMTDHYTICRTKQHAEYPVPFTHCAWEKGIMNKKQRFCEKDACYMPVVSGSDYFDMIFKKGAHNSSLCTP